MADLEVIQNESIFVCGLDSTITEKDIQDLFAFTIGSTPQVKLYRFEQYNLQRVMAEVICNKDQALNAHQKLNKIEVKKCVLNLVSQEGMKTLIISNLPEIISEKDLFLILQSNSPGLLRLIISDDPLYAGKSLGLGILYYKDHSSARDALNKLNSLTIKNKNISINWNEPYFDIMNYLSQKTRALEIKNISMNTNVQGIITTCLEFGPIIRVQKFANKAYVEFEEIQNAQQFYQSMNEKLVDGSLWQIYPCKIKDEVYERDQKDKNCLFSQEFLQENDRKFLIKVGLEGRIPDINPGVTMKANQVMEAVKQAQLKQLELLKLKLEAFNDMGGLGMNQKNMFGGAQNNMMKNQNQNQFGNNFQNMGFNSENSNPNTMNNVGAAAFGVSNNNQKMQSMNNNMNMMNNQMMFNNNNLNNVNNNQIMNSNGAMAGGMEQNQGNGMNLFGNQNNMMMEKEAANSNSNGMGNQNIVLQQKQQMNTQMQNNNQVPFAEIFSNQDKQILDKQSQIKTAFQINQSRAQIQEDIPKINNNNLLEQMEKQPFQLTNPFQQNFGFN